MLSINSDETLRKPQDQNELQMEQNDIPVSFRLHLNFTQFEQLKRNVSILSVSSISSPNNQSLINNKPQSFNRPISKFFKSIKSKIQDLRNRRSQITRIQEVYKDGIANLDSKQQKRRISKHIFDPNNLVYLAFQQVKLFFMLFLLICITFMWSFDLLEQFLEEINYIILISIFLAIDIFISFNLAIIVKGQVIKNRVVIIKHYLTGQFFEDALFLFSLIVLINTEQIVIAAIFYACGTQILYKIINKLQDVFDLSFYASEVMKLIKLILFINLIAHFIACVWHYVGLNTSYLGNTWLDSKGIRNETASIRYIYSFYWSVVTMVTVGYGDIVPINHLEMLVSVFMMFLSCGVFAFSLNLIGQIVSTVNQEKIKLEKNIRTLNNYFKYHNVDEELQNRVKNYLEYQIKEEEKENIKAILQKLPSQLQHEVIQKAYLNILGQTPLLVESFSKILLNNSSHLLQMGFYQPEDIIVNQYFQDDDETALYFIDQGVVQVVELSSKTVLLELTHGQTFCLTEFFTGKQARYSFVCKTKTSIYKLPRKQFLSILMKDDFEKFHEIKHCFDFNIPIKHLKCDLCSSTDHFTDKCNLFFHSPEISKLILREQNLKQQRMNFQRKSVRYQTFKNQQKTLEKQFEFIQTYEQENSNDQENVGNLTIESNLNNLFRLPEKSNSSDLDNNFKRQTKSRQKLGTIIISGNQIKPSTPSKDKSQNQLKPPQSVHEIKEKEINLEFDRMAGFHKYFEQDNYESKIKKYNQNVQKIFDQILPQIKRKNTKAMKFIFDF